MIFPFLSFDAILLYVYKTGCQWRNLPHDFPAWQTVYYYFRAWSAIGELKNLLRLALSQKCAISGRSDTGTKCCGCRCSKCAGCLNIPYRKGFYGNKKVKAIKRQIAVDERISICLDVKDNYLANIHMAPKSV